MKKIYFLVCLLLATPFVFGQNKTVFNLNKLPVQDTLLTGWKFHAGDDPQWAKPNYEDLNWVNEDPGQDITTFNVLKNAGTGWLRLRIRLDSSLSHQQLTAWIFQYTASEIYLDGRLIKKYGDISKNTAQTTAFSPDGDFFKLPLQQGITHVIAVRLAYQSGLPYCSPFFTPLSAFSMFVNDYHSAHINSHNNNALKSEALILCGAFSGMLFIISLIYLFYFLFDKSQKVHLYYSISCAFSFLLDFCFSLFVNTIESTSVQMWMAYIIAISFVLSSIFMLLTIYRLFGYNKRSLFTVVILIGVATLGYILFDDINGFIIATNGYLCLSTLEGIHVSIRALKKKKRGAAIILAGLTSILVLNVWSAFLPQANFSSMVLALMAILGFPLGMSIYLAVQNAITNQTLRVSLSEIQTLSAENLIKEQEKQQILSSQNEVLEKQVTERTAELNQSLNNLKQTQQQLIQSEKLASLGELTAGIAHEIQNPLNFVNNFSEVSMELTVEMKEELKTGNATEAAAIAGNIEQNLQKIIHHGKRADAIVKNMLQHSRNNSAEKQQTDVNALADEYLRLSYYGLRAKDKSFNSNMNTVFDAALPKINIVPQDIGRVLLNLFNNAFYAVQQRKKIEGGDYKPMVEVSTALTGNNIQIKVRDNGTGIPDAVKGKILQPFFTTKPTGEGTGLGLSLSYDIVVKGHGGAIDINSKEGKYTEFTIKIPA